MTHQLLHGADVRTVLQKMHGEAVPEGVGGNVFVNMGRLLIVLEDFPEALAADGGSR